MGKVKSNEKRDSVVPKEKAMVGDIYSLVALNGSGEQEIVRVCVCLVD